MRTESGVGEGLEEGHGEHRQAAQRALPGSLAGVPGGPQKTRHFDRKRDAERFLDAIRGDLAHGTYIDPAGGRMPFREYAEEWRAAQVHRPSTAAQAETYLRRHAYPTLGHRPLGVIRRSEIQGWVKKISATLAPGSVEVVYRWVATIFKAAVGDRLIPASPCIRIALPKRDRKEVLPLEVAQVEAMANAVPDRYRALIVFTAGMGLRPGKAFGLTVDRIDFLRRSVRVDRQLVAVLGGVPEFGPPKSAAGFRTVPMPVVVSDVLAAHLARYRPGSTTGTTTLTGNAMVLRPQGVRGVCGAAARIVPASRASVLCAPRRHWTGHL